MPIYTTLKALYRALLSQLKDQKAYPPLARLVLSGVGGGWQIGEREPAADTLPLISSHKLGRISGIKFFLALMWQGLQGDGGTPHKNRCFFAVRCHNKKTPASGYFGGMEHRFNLFQKALNDAQNLL